MFSQLSHFFIKNSKLTFVFVIFILLSGIASYIFLPKQYNPSITLPAFEIQIPTREMNTLQSYNLIGSEFENAIGELPGVEDIYTTSSENGIGMLVKFFVGQNSQDAKIELYQKISQTLPRFEGQIGTPIIKSINPDDLPQLTYALYYSGKNTINNNTLKYLRNISLEIKNELKTVENVSTFEIIGGGKNYIFLEFNSKKLSEYGLTILSVGQKLESHFAGKKTGSIRTLQGENMMLEIAKSSQEIEDIKNIILSGKNDFIRVKDVAEIKIGENIPSFATYFSDVSIQNTPSVFIGIGKKIGSNSVFVSQDIEQKIQEIKKTLPNDIKIVKIQDEGEEAQKATSLLIKDLIESIGIVVIILVIFLGRKNALNTATSIPLILSLVFLYAYIVGFDINRISLFALILVIGMLVDDSIVVVENIHRHLEERSITQVSKTQAILNAVSEVSAGVVLSTITKILSFVGMFAVTGMMGEYMGPIPKFAIIALIFSIFIAFIINPWISNMTESEEIKTHKTQSSLAKYDIRKYYKKFLEKFINDDQKSQKRRKKLKITFWISLILVTILPIYFGVFKARMLPKSDKDQMYVWIDGQRSYDVQKMITLQNDFQKFLLEKSNFPEELQVIENISSSVGSAFIGDFANLFRGGSQRVGSHQISMRVNFIKKENTKNRLKSEEIVIQLRPFIDDFFSQNYPDVQYRILEDPPGPPVRATFMMNIQSTGNQEDLEIFTNKVLQKVQSIQEKQKIVDLYSTLPTLFEKIRIELDDESITRAGLNRIQIQNEIALLQNQNIVTFQDTHDYKEIHFVTFGVEKDFISNIENLKNYSFTNGNGEKIYLKNIAKFTTQIVPGPITTDKKQSTHSIYGEMGDNSVVYPVISLMSLLKKDDFLGENLKVIKSNFYEIVYFNTQTSLEYKILWDGEWKITMDTFRDLGTAMILSLLVIYFLMVAQFKSFGVGGLIMLPFLLGFYGIFPGFSLLYIFDNQYFNATGMIGIISLGGIVVGNAILLIDYINIRKDDGVDIKNAIIEAGMIRFLPILLTSISAIFGAIKIVGDPVWSGLAWSIVFGLSSSAILTLLILPIFYYDSQKNLWESQKNT